MSRILGIKTERLDKKDLDQIKSYVAKRDGYKCYICHELTSGTDHKLRRGILDHVVPISQGGNNDANNLRIACSRCDMFKADVVVSKEELRDWLRWMGLMCGLIIVGVFREHYIWTNEDFEEIEFIPKDNLITVTPWCKL